MSACSGSSFIPEEWFGSRGCLITGYGIVLFAMPSTMEFHLAYLLQIFYIFLAQEVVL